MRKDLLHAIANLASTQGYKKAKETIEKWDKETDVDRYWAMRIAHIAASDGLGIQAANHAIDNPEQWDGRTESQKMADAILGYNAHFDPDFDNSEKQYFVGGLQEVKGAPGSYQLAETPQEEINSFAAAINKDTKAILKHPDMQPQAAMEREAFLRK
ncbi:hypothetical protein [uncultured Phocaeicola sp.]|uniref:hypothetical protein n=1 Tax=uncultured Phocaeicola sp. TaxID=990718 RepID=UPI0025D6EC69|nr:hypothetical protein [uncultured Phocaeicola sp.]